MIFDEALTKMQMAELVANVFKHDFRPEYRAATGNESPYVFALHRGTYLGTQKIEHAAGELRLEQLEKLLTYLTQYESETGISLVAKGEDRRAFLESLHSNGHAAADVKTPEGKVEKAAYVLVEDQHRTGDKMLEAITGLDVDGEIENAMGAHRAARMRNFWLRYKIGMAIHEANPKILEDMPASRATHFFFRQTHRVFSALGDRQTGPLLINGFHLMALAGGAEAMNIIIGFLPSEDVLAGAQAMMLLQLKHVQFNPHPSPQEVAAFRHERHEMMTSKSGHKNFLRYLTRKLQDEFAARKIPLNRPEAIARSVGHLLEFQHRLAERSIDAQLMENINKLAAYPNFKMQIELSDRISAVRGRDVLHHLQLMLTAGFLDSYKKILGPRAAHREFSDAARTMTHHVLKPKARNGNTPVRKRNGKAPDRKPH